MAKEEEIDLDNEAGEKKSGSSTLKIVIIAVTLALILGGGLVGTTFYFVSNMNTEQATSTGDDSSDSSEEEAESEPVLPPKYRSMDPKFVVSFSDQKKARFMQFSLEIMSRDAEVIKQIESHMPVIRSSLLMLFGNQKHEDMVTREGKQKLLNDVVVDINNSLQKVAGEDELQKSVEAAYFNSFVIQ